MPVARAQLVGLERVERAEHLGHVASDAEVVDADPANHALRVDDERRPQRDAVFVKDAERARELALRVREHRERNLREVRMLLPPREVDVVRVDAQPQHLRVAVAKLFVLPRELGNFGGADEREVHRPREKDEPLSLMALVRERLEFLALLGRNHGLQLERGQLVTNGQHECLLLR